jgi:hypothetical protein
MNLFFDAAWFVAVNFSSTLEIVGTLLQIPVVDLGVGNGEKRSNMYLFETLPGLLGDYHPKQRTAEIRQHESATELRRRRRERVDMSMRCAYPGKTNR